MKAIYKLLALSFVAIGMQSCVNDLQDEINDGKWNHERQVLDIKFENQIGVAEISVDDATSGTINLSINVNAVPDLSDIKLTNLQLSYQAKSSISVGESLNFENPERTAKITVYSTTGEHRDYTIHVSEFAETIEGKWAIQALSIYGGTGPEYGGGAVMALIDKPWVWKENDGPACENDNILTFTMTGVSDEGNTSGTCLNEAGVDNKYADFTYVGNNPENPGETVDLDKFYRKIPVGESTWVRNYAENTITFTDKDGHVTVGRFENAGTEDLGNGISFTIADNAFSFTLDGTDDWTNIYSDYDKFVKKPRKYWITVKRM
ncbi:MAG: hypothetical protein K2G47_12125 [Muribaculum sp.]|nr:hypothetical protein [Muribaculum sp.]